MRPEGPISPPAPASFQLADWTVEGRRGPGSQTERHRIPPVGDISKDNLIERHHAAFKQFLTLVSTSSHYVAWRHQLRVVLRKVLNTLEPKKGLHVVHA